MTDKPLEAYGRLTEGIHITGYTFERACKQLEWLLVDQRWKACGDFVDVNAFLDTLHLDQFRPAAEARQRIAKQIKELQPEASNRQIARTLGVSEGTVRNDAAQNYAPRLRKPRQTNGPAGSDAQNYALRLSLVSHSDDANKELEQQRWATTVNLVEAIAVLDRDPSIATDILKLFDPAVEKEKGLPKITAARLQRAELYVAALAAVWEGEKE